MSEVPAPAEQARSWWQRASSGNMSREANNPSLSATKNGRPQGRPFSFFFPLAPEKFGEKIGAPFCHYPAFHLEPVIQSFVVRQVEEGTDRPSLRIEAAKYHSLHPRLQDRSGAHKTGFARNVYRDTVQSPAFQLFRRLFDQQNFGVPKRVLFFFAKVVRPGYYLVAKNRHSANWHLIYFSRPHGLRDSGFHEIFFANFPFHQRDLQNFSKKSDSDKD